MITSLSVPDGIRVYSGAPRTPGWYSARRAGITATDAVAIAGASVHKTPLHVWLDKRGELPENDSIYAEAGRRLEPVIAQWWADVHHAQVCETGIWAKLGPGGDALWMRCSPDRIVASCPDGDGPCGLEIKNRNAYVSGAWSRDVPDDVLAQCAWTMLCTGWSHVHVAVLIGGNAPLWHRVDRDPTLEAYILDRATEVWAAVQEGTPPVVEASTALTRLLDALTPTRQGRHTISAVEASRMRDLHAAGCSLERDGRVLKDEARDLVVSLLGTAQELCAEGEERPFVTYKDQEKTGISAKDLARLRKEDKLTYSTLADNGYITTSSSRVMRWTKNREE